MSGEVALDERRAELERLSAVFEEKERCLGELRLAVEQFQLRYSYEVGQKQVELNRLNEELEEFMARKYRGGGGDLQPKGLGVETKGAKVAPQAVPDLKEVKRFYRKVAALIHPDKAAAGSCRAFRTALMADLNEAYVRQDSAGMQGILEQWNESPEAVVGDGPSAEWERSYRAIAQIKRKIETIDRESSIIVASDMYVMMVNVQEAERLGRNVLSEMTAALNAKVEYAKNTLLMRMYG